MILLMLSRQRSGTGAIASVLERHPLFVYGTEILDPASEKSVFLYLERRGISCKTSYAFCEGFITYISSLAADKDQVHMIDIKYNSLGAFSPPFYSFLEIPWILYHFSQLSVPMLHLVRPNLLDVFVSAKLAEANGVWHLQANNKARITKISLDINEFIQFQRIAIKEDAFFQDFFSGYKFHLELSYYDCFAEDGELSETAAESLSKFLNVDLMWIDRKPRFVKQSSWSIEDKVENYAEIRELVASSNR